MSEYENGDTAGALSRIATQLKYLTVCDHSGAGTASAWWQVTTFAANQAASAIMPDATTGTGVNAALYLRIQTPGTAGADALACDFFPGNTPNLVRVSEWTDGVQSVLNSTTAFDVNDGHKIGCEAIGDQLCAHVDVGSGWQQAVCNCIFLLAGRPKRKSRVSIKEREDKEEVPVSLAGEVDAFAPAEVTIGTGGPT